MNHKNWILVTGATGFIGFTLVKSLISLNYNVKIVTRQETFSKEFQEFIDRCSKTQLSVIRVDIKNSDALENIFKDVKFVYHVAALVNATLAYDSFYNANVIATQNICELCLKYNITKLIYVSTSDVFGLPKRDEIFTEISPYKYWQEPYPDTKIEATACVKKYMKKGLLATIIYPGWVYGPGDKAFLPSVLEQLKSGIMPIWDKNSFKITFVYIDDLVLALINVLNNEKSNHEDFLILNDKSETTLTNLCQQLGVLFNLKFKIIRLPYFTAYALAWVSQKMNELKIVSKPMMSTTDVKSFGYPFVFSTKKAATLLHWESKTSLKTGLSNWKEWHINQ